MKNYYLKQKRYWRKLIPLIALPLATVLSGLSARAQTYCTINYQSGCGNWGVYGANSVTVGAFTSSPTSCGTSDYTSQTINLSAGVSTAVSLATHGWTSVGVAMDLNSDGDFADPDEVLALPIYADDPTGNHTYNFNIVVPPYAVSGNYRLRIWTRSANGGGDNNGVIPCGTYGYGNYYDYTLAVTNTATCLPPSVLVVVPSSTTASFSWTAATTSPQSYDWKIVADGGNPITDAGVASGNVTGTTGSASGLASSTAYQLYARSECTSVTDTSAWSLGASFSTLCAGAPVAGVAGTSVSPVCGSTSFTLSLTGNTIGPGINYQWQSSPAGAGTFTNISGATSATYTSTQIAGTDYRCYLICTGSSLSDTSTLINVAQNPVTSCYCVPTSSYDATSYYITGFSTTGGSANISNTGTGSGAYNDYSASQTASALMGSTVNFSITGNSPYEARAIYIDWNHDGDFDDTGETVYTNSSTSSSIATGSFTIPYSAAIGNTRMRVRVALYYYGVTPCDDDYYSEAEDYTINVVPLSGICVFPVNLAVSNITPTTANAGFNTPPGGNTPTNYIFEVRTDGTAAGSGLTGLFTGGATADTTLTFTSLSPGTDYKLFVRTFCSVGDTSDWTSITFSTTFDTLTYVAYSGANADVVADGIGTATSSTTNDVDGASYGLVAYNFQAVSTNALPSHYLPESRIMQNGVRKYKLQKYKNTNNSIRMPNGSSGTAKFLASKRANKVYIMGVSGSGTSTTTATLYFHDGSTQTASLSYPDWFNSGSNVASAVGRVHYTNDGLDNGPYLHDATISVGTASRDIPIDSIGFSNSGNVMNVMAVSIVPNVNQTCTMPLSVDSVYNITSSGATVAWHGNGSGTNYQVSFGQEGTYANAGNIITATGSGANATSSGTLSAATNYQVFVRTDCGGGSYSDWIGPINFTTLSNDCNGTPSTGTLTSTSLNVCTNTPYTLTVGNVPSSNGISLKWQSSPTGQNNWATLSTVTPSVGVSSYTYSVASQSDTTDYRCIITCSLSGDSSVSNVLTVNQNAFNVCYCIPGATNAGSSDIITNVNFAGLNNSSTNAPDVNGYADYTALTPAVVIEGSTYPVSVSVSNGGTEFVSVWIDYNHNGIFDASEYKLLGSANNATISNTLAIPTTAESGLTRMRFRVKYNGEVGSGNPCAAYTYGETEDYMVNIIAQTACAGTPAPGNTVSSVSSLCVSGTANLSLDNNYITYSGITYQWQSSTNGTDWSDISSATSYSTTSPTITQTTGFRCRLICSAGPDTAYSTPAQVSVHALPTVTVSPSQGAFCTSGSATLTASGADTYAWTPSATLDAATGTSVVATPSSITTYTITGTDVNGCVNTATATVGPIAAFTPAATAANVCGANLPVTINVTPIATTDGSMEYSLTDTVGTVIGNWQAGTSFTVTPTSEGAYKYYVFARSTNCTSSVSDTGTATFYAGFSGVVTVNNATCSNGDGSFVVGNVQGPGTGNAAAVWYSNDFNTTTVNTTYAEIKGDAIITGNHLQLTPNAGSKNGAIVIKNPTSISGHLDSVKFVLSVPTSGADGLSWSFGDNLVYSTTAGLEQGLGDKLIVSFDAYGTSGLSVAGIYLTYGQNNAANGGISTTNSPTMLAYSNNTSWRGASNKQIRISISNDNKLTLTVGTTVIFSQVQLPAGYANADKSSWTQIIGARTGGVSEEHSIDDLGVYYNGTSYSYGSSAANSGTVPATWQSSPVFGGLSGGDSLDIWVANPSAPATCNKFLGTYGVTAPVTTSLIGTSDPTCIGAQDGYIVLKVDSASTYDVSYKKNGGNTITQNDIASGNDGTNEYVLVQLGQGAYTNFKVTRVSTSCVSNTIAGPITLTAPDATAIPATSSTSDSMNQPGAGTQYYTDASCELIAAVTSPNDLDTVIANVTVGAPVTSPGGEPFVGRYVDIVPGQNANLPATVKLYFTTADFTNYNASPSVGTSAYPAILPDNSNLRIRAFHGLPSSGTTGPNGIYDATNSDILQPTSVVWNASGTGFWEVTVYSPNGFSGFFANTTIGSPLNITIGKIAAHNEGAVNVVNWDTKTEAANDYFVMERSSDGKAFASIGTVEGKGKAPSDYSFTDTKPFNGISYYRLILMNADGSRQYSRVVTAEVKGGNKFRLNVFPNPASTEVSVSVSEVIGSGVVELTDITGRVLSSQTITNSATISLSLNGLADGIYIVKYHDDANIQNVKVNKKQ